MKITMNSCQYWFIKKAIHNKVVPKFAEVKGQCLNNNNSNKHDREIKIPHSHLLQNKRNLSRLTSKLRECRDDLIISFGKIFASITLLKSIEQKE